MTSFKEEYNKITKIELVISRYSEKLDWINNPMFDEDVFYKTIYNKSNNNFNINNKNTRVINLNNVGRESHTFLYHIIENYDNLSDITVFLPGSCMDQLKQTKTEFVISKVKETKNSVISGQWYNNVRQNLKNFCINDWKGSNESNQKLLPTSECKVADIRPFGQWFFNYFGSIQINIVSYNSIFAIAKEHILQHNKSHFERLISCLENHSNPEEGHYMERAWAAVFYPLPECCLYYSKQNRNTDNSNKIEKSNEIVNTSKLSLKQQLELLSKSNKRIREEDVENQIIKRQSK